MVPERTSSKKLFRRRCYAPLLLALALLVWFGPNWLAADLNRRARHLLNEGRLDDAARVLAFSPSWVTNHSETQFVLARIRRNQGKLSEARRHLERAFQLGFPVEQLEREHWLMLAQIGRLDEAEKHLAEVLRNSQGDERAVCEAFVSGYLLTRQHAKALHLLAVWETAFPDDPQPHFIRGTLHRDYRQFADAEREFRRALALRQQHYRAAYALAVVLLEQSKPAEALKSFRHCRDNVPDPLLADLGIARCLRQLGQTIEADRILGSVLTQDPHNAEALLERGRLRLDVGKPQDAVRLLEQASP